MPTLFLAASLLALSPFSGSAFPPFRTGDVVLQTSKSPMSLPIREATHSPWSHTGLIEVTEDGVFVLEAIQPVSRTPYEVWRKRGVGGAVKVLRLKDLDPKAAAKSVAWAKSKLGGYRPDYRRSEARLLRQLGRSARTTLRSRIMVVA